MLRLQKIGQRSIGAGTPVFLIAEVAQAHDGSLGAAHAFVEVAAQAGADAIKFQTHFAAEESTLDEPFRVQFSQQDETRYGYWQRMEFSEEQWAGLASHARERELIFLSSPFSTKAVDLLDRLGVPAWKVASGETNSGGLLEAMISTGKPLLMSTGMSSWNEIDAQIAYLEGTGNGFAILQCTSRYPTSLEDVGMNVLVEMREKFDCPVGLSDHSGTPYPALAAMAQGVDLVELHIAMHKLQFGPDTPASLTPDQFAEIARARDAFHVLAGNPVEKDEMAEALAPTRAIFSRSLAPAFDLAAGTVLTEDMIALRKPGTGIPESRKEEIIGRRLAHDVVALHLFQLSDFVE